MADVPQAGSISAALGENAVVIKDLSGKEHRLRPLRFGDLGELERITGHVGDWTAIATSMIAWQAILWLSMRREGLKASEIKNRQWKITYDDVGDMFDGSQLEMISGVILKILGMSGLAPKKTPDPQSGADEMKTTDGSPSSTVSSPSVSP